jgi:hypothetical protein
MGIKRIDSIDEKKGAFGRLDLMKKGLRQEPRDIHGNDGVLRVATEAEWEKHRIAGVSVSPAEQAKHVRLEKSLAEAKERLASVVSRMVVAEHDQDLQLQHKYLKGKVDMLAEALDLTKKGLRCRGGPLWLPFFVRRGIRAGTGACPYRTLT